MADETAYVWVWLPQQTMPVVCAQITISKDGEQHLGTFVYEPAYLECPEARALDPVRLPLVAEAQRFTALGGIPSALLDAGPDAWGRSLIEFLHGGKFSSLGYLLRSSDGAGNLGFSPNRESLTLDRGFASAVPEEGREIWAEAIEALEQNERLEPHLLSALLSIQPGIGGARPKVTMCRDDACWIAKFPSFRDTGPISNPSLEFFSLTLARQCGINTVHCQLEQIGGKDVLLVKRFDRPLRAGQVYRHAFLSGRTLLHVDEALARYAFSGSYQRLASSLQRYSIKPEEDQHELFRRLCFNVMIGNTDDHELNHGLVNIDGQGFVLGPAYDLVPQRHHSATSRRHALQIGPDFLGTRDNVISCAEAFSLDARDATEIFDTMTEQIRDTWQDVAFETGFDEAGCRFLGWEIR